MYVTKLLSQTVTTLRCLQVLAKFKVNSLYRISTCVQNIANLYSSTHGLLISKPLGNYRGLILDWGLGFIHTYTANLCVRLSTSVISIVAFVYQQYYRPYQQFVCFLFWPSGRYNFSRKLKSLSFLLWVCTDNPLNILDSSLTPSCCILTITYTKRSPLFLVRYSCSQKWFKSFTWSFTWLVIPWFWMTTRLFRHWCVHKEADHCSSECLQTCLEWIYRSCLQYTWR